MQSIHSLYTALYDRHLFNDIKNYHLGNVESLSGFIDSEGDISISVNTEDFGLPHIVIWVKETPYRSTLRDPRESRANYRWRPCHPRGAGNCKSSQTRLTQWDSYSVRNIENIPT
ncbi:hypothetical protein U3516DRAFT_744346 [Neocallimastix sp. 'constans']